MSIVTDGRACAPSPGTVVAMFKSSVAVSRSSHSGAANELTQAAELKADAYVEFGLPLDLDGPDSDEFWCACSYGFGQRL